MFHSVFRLKPPTVNLNDDALQQFAEAELAKARKLWVSAVLVEKVAPTCEATTASTTTAATTTSASDYHYYYHYLYGTSDDHYYHYGTITLLLLLLSQVAGEQTEKGWGDWLLDHLVAIRSMSMEDRKVMYETALSSGLQLPVEARGRGRGRARGGAARRGRGGAAGRH